MFAESTGMPGAKKYFLLISAALLSGICTAASGQENITDEVQEAAPPDSTAAPKESRIGVAGMPSLSFEQSQGQVSAAWE